MKKNSIIIIVLIVVLGLGIGGFFLLKDKDEEKEKEKEPNNNAVETLTDAQRFAKEYSGVNEDNVFVYKNVDEIIKIMENGTGVVYLGYPECPWCGEYVKYLNEVAKEVGIEKIYYGNTKKIKEEDMDKYHKLITLLSGHLQHNDEGEEWIYVPNVSFHIDGKIVGNDYETSKDTHGLKDPKEYWTEKEIKDLKKNLKKPMEKVQEALSVCTDCNK